MTRGRVVSSSAPGYNPPMRTFKPFAAISFAAIVMAVPFTAGCAGGGGGGGGGVMDKVLTDFGIREPGEDYVAPSDRVFDRLDGVGAQELRRLNSENRQGTVHFQEDTPLTGKYYREVKVYERYTPLDAQRVSRGRGQAEYVCYIQYNYTVYQSDRFNTRTEAEAAPADINTGERGTEVYRYNVGPTGVWQGRRGELTRR